LIEWFRIVQHAPPPVEKQLDIDALDKATKIFLDSLTERPSDKKATYVPVKLSTSAKKPAVR
jgi:hypothetical protein